MILLTWPDEQGWSLGPCYSIDILSGISVAWKTHTQLTLEPFHVIHSLAQWGLHYVNVIHSLKTGRLRGQEKEREIANLAKQFQEEVGAYSAISCFFIKFIHQQTELPARALQPLWKLHRPEFNSLWMSNERDLKPAHHIQRKKTSHNHLTLQPSSLFCHDSVSSPRKNKIQLQLSKAVLFIYILIHQMNVWDPVQRSHK